MSIAEAVLEKLNALPPEKQAEVLEFANALSTKKTGGDSHSFLDVALSLNLQGPADWSEKFEEYLEAERSDAQRNRVS